MSEIRTKENQVNLKKREKLINTKINVKAQLMTIKSNKKVSKETAKEESNQTTQTVDSITKQGKQSSVHSANMAKEMIRTSVAKNIVDKKKEKEQERKEIRDDIKNSHFKTESKAECFIGEQKSIPGSFSETSKIIKANESRENVSRVKEKFAGSIKKKIKTEEYPLKTKNVSIKVESRDSNQNIKKVIRLNHHKKTNSIKDSKKRVLSHRTSIEVVKKSFSMIKRTFFSFTNLVSTGISLILLLVFILFIGVFSALSDTTVVGSTYAPLSEEVLAYTDTITKYAEQYDMDEYIMIIQAVMMQESGGKGQDPMQCSECPYNTKYPQIPNGIEDAEYSIQVGIHYLSDCFKAAGVEDPFDNERISLALQGYNYGGGYIQWAITNFGGYSKANAKVFSDQKKAELGWDTYGDPNYVEHVFRYIGLGFGNYREQPNFSNMEAWGSNNPYSRAGLYGQCTWFAWGRFYEIYGYSPGFTGNGWDCAKQLVKAHPDKFKLSKTPAVGAVFSCVGRNHVGIVIGWDGNNITIQEGNLDNKTNSFAEAKKDWHTVTYTLSQFVSICNEAEFAVSMY